MLLPYIEQALAKVETIKSPCKIIFLKGFDTDTIQLLTKKYPRFYEGSYLTDKGINLEGLEQQKKSILKALLTIEEGTFLGLYEEYIFLNDKMADLFDGEIIIVNNNYFNGLYPSGFCPQTNKALLEYKDHIEQENILEENNSDLKFIGDYISNIVEINNELFISYLDKTEEHKLNKIDILDNSIVQINLQEAEDINDFVEFSFANTYDLLNLKVKILNNLLPVNQEINILTEKSILKTTELLNSLKTLQVLTQGYYKINYFYRNKFTRKEVRQVFKDIINNYWKSPDFRILDFYENPDESIEKVKISQGELVETIVSEES